MHGYLTCFVRQTIIHADKLTGSRSFANKKPPAEAEGYKNSIILIAIEVYRLSAGK